MEIFRVSLSEKDGFTYKKLIQGAASEETVSAVEYVTSRPPAKLIGEKPWWQAINSGDMRWKASQPATRTKPALPCQSRTVSVRERAVSSGARLTTLPHRPLRSCCVDFAQCRIQPAVLRATAAVAPVQCLALAPRPGVNEVPKEEALMTAVPNTTASVGSSHERVEQFQQLVSHAFAPLHIRSNEIAGPVGSLRSVKPGGVMVTRITGGPCTVLRSRSLIGSSDPELVKVVLYGHGRAGAEQDGRQCLPTPGDLVVYDTTRPYELQFWDSFDLIVLGIPRALLGPHVHPLASRTASPVPTDSGGRRLAAALLRDAASDPDACSGSGAPHLADALVSVVLSALAEQPVAVRPTSDLAEQILTYSLGRLADPSLSPESVARAHHVSVRYLYKILQQRDVTLASWIRRHRLERIRRDLADPTLADRSVASIAAEWGVLDATHISRALRAEFGQSAVEIRGSVVGYASGVNRR